MNKLNLYTWFGLIFISIWFVSNKFMILNQNLNGLFIGLGFTFVLLGILTQNYDLLNFRENQRSFYRRFIGKNKKRQRKI